MKAHELAKKLLDGPDITVVLAIRCANNTVSSIAEDCTPVDNIEILLLSDESVEVSAYV